MARKRKSQRMETVVRLARHDERSAGQALARARQVLEAQLQRLQELEDYRRDYARRFSELGGGGIDMARLNEYRRFIARLDEAIRQQRQHLERCQEAVEHSRQAWQQARLRHQAVDDYRQRCVHEERCRDLQYEQKESDERAQRQGRPR